MRIARTARSWVFALALALLTWGCVRGSAEAPEPGYIETVTGSPEAGADLPLIVAIHGLGDRPEIFARTLVSEFPFPARFVFPRGLEPAGDGYSWFEMPAGPGSARASMPEGIRGAGDSLAALITRLAREHASSVPPVVFGYSQGGVLSYYLAAQYPEAIAGAVPVAGFLPAELRPTSRPAPVRAFHGGVDSVVPVEAARATVQSFVEAGGRAELVEYPHLGHPMSLAMVRAVQRAVAELAENAPHRTREAAGAPGG